MNSNLIVKHINESWMNINRKEKKKKKTLKICISLKSTFVSKMEAALGRIQYEVGKECAQLVFLV